MKPLVTPSDTYAMATHSDMATIIALGAVTSGPVLSLLCGTILSLHTSKED